MQKRSGWLNSRLLWFLFGAGGATVLALWASDVVPGAYTDKYRFLLEENIEEHEEGATESIVVLVIVLSLIAMTIMFEIAKEHVEEHADSNMKRIIEKLFGEMTVLGFLSICTFCVTKSGYFSIVSARIYDGDRHELLELFEQIHFAIFAIMVFFVLQVLVLVHEAMETESRWIQMDYDARGLSPQSIATGWEGRNRRQAIWKLLPGFRRARKRKEAEEDLVMFYSIRKEFLLDRNVEPPFAPSAQQLPEDFAFGRYLSVCLGTMLAHVVEVSNATWMLFAVGSCLYAGLHWVLEVEGLAIVWVTTGWLVFVLDIVFESHLLLVRDLLASPDTSEDTPSVTTPLQAESSLLPGWTRIDLDAYRKRRSWIIKRWVGGSPNRQQALYWADRKGPKLYLLALQIKLIFVGLYLSVHLLEFWGPLHEKYSSSVLSGYVVLSVFPILATIFQAQHLVATLSQVCCLGSYRRPNVIVAVLREDKTRAVVRSFLCIYKMRRFAALASQLGAGPRSAVLLSDVEQEEVYKTFDSFDLDGKGTITLDEIKQLMLSLGAPMSESDLAAVLSQLDEDGDNQITRDEFLQWYSQTMVEDDGLSVAQQGAFLFSLFDNNGSGEITIGEFQSKLDAMNAGFSVDDIGAIVNELDEDNSGTLGVHEFEHLLHTYHPRELLIAASTRSQHTV